MTARPHDAVFKAVFEVPAYAVALCEAVIPAEEAALLDWGSLQLEPASFVDDDLADSHGDLLFSVERRGGGRSMVYVLVEHQSRVDEAMPLRFVGYLLQIWWRAYRAAPGSPLPVIVPVVLSHAPSGWTAARALEDLFEPELKVPGLGAFVPRFRVLVEDLATISNGQILARVRPAVVRLVWWLLRDARDPTRILAEIAAWAPVFEQAAREDTRGLTQLLRYLTLLAEQFTLDEIRANLRQQAPLTSEVMMTAGEALLSQGRAEGRAEGRALALRQLLVAKFGALAATHEAQLASATAEQLDRWLGRILTAATVDDVLRA